MYSESNCIVAFDGEDCTIQGKCLLTDELQTVQVKTEDYQKWIKGEGNIDELMPYLNQSEKNFLSHGVTDEGWSKVTEPKPKISIPKAQ